MLLAIGGTREDVMLIFPGIITVSVIVSGMEAYVPQSFSQPKSSKPWFNPASSLAIHDREVAHKVYLSLSSPESNAL